MTYRKARAMIMVIAFALAMPASAKDFYAGKSLTIVVANPPGSGYDSYGRLLARHLPKHIPGNPTIIVQNMPGAGGIKATDYTANVAVKDGTIFMLTMPGALIEPLTDKNTNARYDPTQLLYIGTMDSGTRLCMTTQKSKVRSIEDARKTRIILAAGAVGGSPYDYAHFINALAGTKFHVVTGYPGPADMLLAAERGEVDGVCGLDISTFTATRPGWLTGESKGHPLVQIGLETNAYATSLGFPPIWNFINSDDKQLVELIISQQVFQRTFLAPPGTPEAQIKMLRMGFIASLNDPALIEEAKRSNLALNPKSGEEVEALIKKIYSSPSDLVQRMTRVIRP